MRSNFDYCNKFNPCQICEGKDSECRRTKKTTDILHFCRKTTAGTDVPGFVLLKGSKDGLWAIYKKGDPYESSSYTAEEKASYWAAREEIRKQERVRQDEENEERLAKQTPIDTRHSQYVALLAQETLTTSDYEMLSNKRGMTPAQVKCRIYRDTKGLHHVCRGLDGKYGGSQLETNRDPKYIWDNKGDVRRSDTDQNPLQWQGNKVNPKQINLVEGTNYKVYISADQTPNELWVGASGGQFVSSSKEIDLAIAKFPNSVWVLYPDAGSFTNHSVNARYDATKEYLEEKGVKLKVALFGQYEKCCGDIDEIPVERKRRTIEYWQYTKVRSDYVKSKSFNTLTAEADLELNQEFLTSDINLTKALNKSIKGGQLTFISSPVGTGKTQFIQQYIKSKEALIGAEIPVISLVSRISLANQQMQRLEISNYKVGSGQSQTYLNDLSKKVIVIDSLLDLDLGEIKPKTLLVLDECAQTLSHTALGGTLKSRAADVQAHLTEVIKVVITSGGSVLCLEDGISDSTVNNYLQLSGTGNVQPCVVTNAFNKFNYSANIAEGTQQDAQVFLIELLKAGKKINVATASQKYAKQLHRYVEQVLPELASKILRIDAQTMHENKEILGNTSEYLSQQGIRLMITSPAFRDGFTIDDIAGEAPLFDLVFGFFTNLDTRTHWQMIHRYRGNCPRYLYVKSRGAEASNSTCEKEILRNWEKVASESALASGHGKIQNSSVGQTWNLIEAKIKAEANLSALDMIGYLRLCLLERGHIVTETSWVKLVEQHCIEFDCTPISPDEVKDGMSLIKEEIEREDAQALYVADPGNMTVEQAQITLASPDSSNELKLKADKCLIQDQLPGVELSADFLFYAKTSCNGRLFSKIKRRHYLPKREMCEILDRLSNEKAFKAAHYRYSTASHTKQQHDLVAPILEDLESLESGEEYLATDERVLNVAKYMCEHWEAFKTQFGITAIYVENIKQCSYLAICNKLIRWGGYDVKQTRQATIDGLRVRFYTVTDISPETRQIAYQGLTNKDILIVTKHQPIESIEIVTPGDCQELHNIPITNNYSYIDIVQELETLPVNQLTKNITMAETNTKEQRVYTEAENKAYCVARAAQGLNMDFGYTQIDNYYNGLPLTHSERKAA